MCASTHCVRILTQIYTAKVIPIIEIFDLGKIKYIQTIWFHQNVLLFSSQLCINKSVNRRHNNKNSKHIHNRTLITLVTLHSQNTVCHHTAIIIIIAASTVNNTCDLCAKSYYEIDLLSYYLTLKCCKSVYLLCHLAPSTCVYRRKRN